jgi:hypothetical protein
MITRQLGDTPIAQQIDPAVPGVPQISLIIYQQEDGTSRAHAATMPIPAGALQNDPIGLNDGGIEAIIDRQLGSKIVEETLADSLYRELTGDLTARSTTHSIRNDHEMEAITFVADVADGVLIYLSLKPCVSSVSNRELLHKL